MEAWTTELPYGYKGLLVPEKILEAQRELPGKGTCHPTATRCPYRVKQTAASRPAESGLHVPTPVGGLAGRGSKEAVPFPEEGRVAAEDGGTQ